MYVCPNPKCGHILCSERRAIVAELVHGYKARVADADKHVIEVPESRANQLIFRLLDKLDMSDWTVVLT